MGRVGVEKFYKPVEVVESEINSKLDINIFRRKSNAKTPSGLILSYAIKAKKDGNMNTAIFLQELFKKIYALEVTEKIQFESWRKKGGIRVWAEPDNILVEFAGRRDKEDKPNIKIKEYSKVDVNKMIFCINQLKDEYNNRIPSRVLGEKFYGGGWDLRVFSKRTDHMKFTHLLGILDYYQIIKYNRRGFTSVIKEVREIQEVLK